MFQPVVGVVVVAPARRRRRVRGRGATVAHVGVTVGAVVGAVAVFGWAHLRSGGGLLHTVF